MLICWAPLHGIIIYPNSTNISHVHHPVCFSTAVSLQAGVKHGMGVSDVQCEDEGYMQVSNETQKIKLWPSVCY